MAAMGRTGLWRFTKLVWQKLNTVFSTDPNLRGAPTGHTVPVREVRISAGAGFIVVVCGEIMTMPGLPRVPAAESIYLNKFGEIEGLF
jgi:Formyltetrahydrofolate synthetase